MASLYKERVAKGLCGACGKQPISANSKSLCDADLAKSKERAAAKRQAKMTSGECLYSGCHVPAASGRYCLTHAAGQAEALRAKTAERKAAGKCVGSTGCTNPVKPGCTMCQSCIDKRSKVSTDRYYENKAAGLCPYCSRKPASGEVLCDYHKAKTRDYRWQVKVDALTAYGGVCALCGNADLDILEIDHVNNDGAAHRRAIGMAEPRHAGHQFYQWLKAQGYPNDPPLRVLCPTCNKKAHTEAKKQN